MTKTFIAAHSGMIAVVLIAAVAFLAFHI